jgi:hypothetical protein
MSAMKAARTCLLAGLASCVAGPAYDLRVAAQPAPGPRDAGASDRADLSARRGLHGALERHDGLRVLRLWGTPTERGYAHGAPRTPAA